MSDIRKRRRLVLTAPRDRYTADEKKERLDRFNRLEEQVLSDILEKRKLIYDTDALDY